MIFGDSKIGEAESRRRGFDGSSSCAAGDDGALVSIYLVKKN
jgi:hypothetical protein